MEIEQIKTTHPRPKPEKGAPLPFGKIFTDHMFEMRYDGQNGWNSAKIMPFGEITISPAAGVLHYAQEVFEGLRAYPRPDGGVGLFRPEMNAKRFKVSCERLCIPPIEEADFIDAVKAAADFDRDWMPTGEGASLYLRPFIFGDESKVGVTASRSYRFMIIISPCGPYYSNGLEPVGIWVEEEYVRSVRGCMGFAKTGGNYAAALAAQEKAHAEGYAQVLWLDGVERRYIEEVGAMNIFFVIGDTVCTPSLSGSILAGITRDSVLHLCRSWGIKTEERRITVDEIEAAAKSGELREVFGTGTAAMVSPVGRLRIGEKVLSIAGGGIGELTYRLYNQMHGIQFGELPDDFGWITVI